MRKIFILLIIISLVGCTRTMNGVIQNEPSFKGEVIEIHSDSILVNVSDEEELNQSYDCLFVSLDVEMSDSMKDFDLGDIVQVYYDGNILDKACGVVEKVYAICLLEPAIQDKYHEENSLTLVNPMQKCNSLEEINQLIGSDVVRPEVELYDEVFYVINTECPVGEYSFFYQDIKYTLRFAKTEEDISGIYYNGNTLGALHNDSEEVLVIHDYGVWTRWFDGDIQYSLTNNVANATDTKDISAVKELFK